MKRISIIFCLTVYIFGSVFVIPSHRAYANPLAVAIPAGIEIGAGVYVTSAIALAALAGAFGYTQYEEDIREHAAAVWASANEQVKKSLRASIEFAISAGNKAISLSRDVYDFILAKVGEITSVVRKSVNVPESTQKRIYSPQGFANFSSASSVSISPSEPYKLVQYVDGKPYATFVYGGYNDYTYSGTYFTFDYITYSGKTFVSWGSRKVEVEGKLAPTTISGVITWFNNAMSKVGVTLELVPVSHVESISPDTIKKSGVLSWDQDNDTPVIALPKSFPAVSTTGKTLTWDEGAKVWKDGSGVAVPQTDVVVKSPDIVLNPSGVSYKDVVTGELVPVRTGEGVGTGEEGGTTGTLDFSPLIVSFSDLSKKFPFSIPFDFYNFIKFLDVPPSAPRFDINVSKSVEILGNEIPIRYKFSLDFSVFDDLAKAVRFFLLVVFDISLILALRRFTPD